MPPITELAYAKINLSLHVIGRRVDGYHELSSIVAFADVADVLTLMESKANKLEITGPFAADVPTDESNSIWKARAWLAARMDLPCVHVKLEKNLPVASGIGGGSADAAAMLRGLLLLVGKHLSDLEITGLATSLGADVPVCFHARPCVMEGIGEKISALTIELPKAIVLVNPLLPCSTASVFKAMGLTPGQNNQVISEIWRNDMTAAALKVQPMIEDVLNALSQTRLHPTLMSGSGATCFGLAQSLAEAEAEAVKFQKAHPQWWVKPARLLT